ncbi:MAG: hypothetical protein M1833_002464 [Piccolia ochrophora]|nr:MAG: hypothetical protein M1833_002464 [Piccolia ochrophora]
MSPIYGPNPPASHARAEAHPPSGQLSSGIKMYVNAVYYLNQHVYNNQPPSTLKLGIISHVFYAFAKLERDGTVQLGDQWADSQMAVDGQRGCLGSFAALKQQHPHLKLILSIGGGNGSEHFAAVASHYSRREKFGGTARALVDHCGLDGIDIDWESPCTAQEGQDYSELIATARRHLPTPQFLLTSAWPAGAWALQHIDVALAQRYLDYINLMTYDFSGPWVDAAGHHAQLWSPQHPHNDAAKLSGHSAVCYLRSRGVLAHKLILGIPAYGRSFVGARGVGDAFTGHGGSDGAFEYKELPRPGSYEQVDQTACAAFTVGGEEGFVSYDNPQTVSTKAGYVVSTGLGGLFYWTGTGDGQGPKSLVETGFKTLHGQIA